MSTLASGAEAAGEFGRICSVMGNLVSAFIELLLIVAELPLLSGQAAHYMPESFRLQGHSNG
jgi:hypothetical protein